MGIGGLTLWFEGVFGGWLGAVEGVVWVYGTLFGGVVRQSNVVCGGLGAVGCAHGPLLCSLARASRGLGVGSGVAVARGRSCFFERIRSQ